MKQMHELIAVDSAPARLEANFSEVEKALKQHLAQFDTVVTADTVKEAKATATDINKLRQAIRSRVKEAVDAVSAPISEFRDRGKKLESHCEEARQTLLAQVQKFEDETRALAEKLLTHERWTLWAKHKVDDEFRRAEIDDLILLTSVTGTGKLTAKARGELDSRVLADARLQDQTERRLLALENASYKAGLSAPLNRNHVQHFLFADDETYGAELQRIINAELTRQEQAEQAIRDKLRREQEQEEATRRAAEERKARQEAAQREAEKPKPEHTAPAEQEAEEPNPAPEPEPEPPKPAASGKVAVEVSCTFSLQVNEELPDAAIERELWRMLQKAGFTNKPKISVRRHQVIGGSSISPLEDGLTQQQTY